MKRVHFLTGRGSARSIPDWAAEQEADEFLSIPENIRPRIYVNTYNFVMAALCLVVEKKHSPFILCVGDDEYVISENGVPDGFPQGLNNSLKHARRLTSVLFENLERSRQEKAVALECHQTKNSSDNHFVIGCLNVMQTGVGCVCGDILPS